MNRKWYHHFVCEVCEARLQEASLETKVSLKIINEIRWQVAGTKKNESANHQFGLGKHPELTVQTP